MRGKEEEGGVRGKQEDEVVVRHENGSVSMTEARYAALREAAETNEEVREAEEKMKEAKEKLRVAKEEVRKAKESRPEDHASVRHGNGFVTMTDTQYSTLLEAADAQKMLRVLKTMCKPDKEMKGVVLKLAKAREELRKLDMTKRTFGSEVTRRESRPVLSRSSPLQWRV